MKTDVPLPRWVRVCDLMVCVLVALGLGVALAGGFRLQVAGIRLLSVTSASRLLFWAVLIGIVRQFVVHDAPLPVRAYTLVRALPSYRGIRLARAAYIGSTIVFVVAVAGHYRPGTGWTELINFGDRFDRVALPAVRSVPHYVHTDSWGYDGQFYAQLAVDPLLRDPALNVALDTPAFRARRILFSWTAYAAGVGHPSWILQAYAVQNIACWLLLSWVLCRWFPPGRARSFYAWFACLFTSGLMTSVRLALTDGPSMLLIALALAAFERSRVWVAAAVLGIAGLGRETNVLAGVIFCSPARLKFLPTTRVVAYGCAVALPLVLWMQYVHAVFHAYDTGIGSFDTPFSAYLGTWRTALTDLMHQGWRVSARYSLYALVSLTVEAVYLAWRPAWRNPWWRVGVVYGALLFLVGPTVWEGHPGAVTRALLPLTFAFNVLILEDRWFWPLYVLGNLTVLHGLATIDVLSPTSYL